MNLTDPIFTNPDAARAYLEASRWADGVFCPHCGGTEKCRKLEGKSHRAGLYQCGDCRQQFTVTVGTVFERSKVPLNKWLLATHLMASSKKGMSAHQLHRSLGVTYKTAWFMEHRIREAMRDDAPVSFSSGGGAVKVDETFIGRNKAIKPVGEKKGRGFHHKYKILALVDRESSKARSIVLDDLKKSTLLPILRENIAKEAVIYTDEASQYRNLKRDFADHDFVSHGAGEYGRGVVHTNTVEGYFSVFKRGMKGVYQHCGRQHLHRYASEFEFRYNHRTANGAEDTERAGLILKGAEGKRLTYRRLDARASA